MVLVCLASLSFIPGMIKANTDYNYDHPSSTIQIITLTVIYLCGVRIACSHCCAIYAGWSCLLQC